MTRIFKHLIRIIKHKYWVARYCFQLGLYWQGIVHDWSKFSYTEFSRSIKYWDDTISPLANEKTYTDILKPSYIIEEEIHITMNIGFIV